MNAPVMPKAHFVENTAKENFVYMANSFASFDEPLFAHLAGCAADDDDILALAGSARAGQPTAYLFLCAVHYLLIRNPAEKLARYFPSLESQPLPCENSYPIFREFCLRHADAIRALISTRTLQTTTAARSVNVLLALSHVAAQIAQPLHVIEIGCSAGLLMLFDRYRYELNGIALGDADSPVCIRPEIRGHLPENLRIPAIASITGIDLQPIDINQPEAADWLRALTFPTWVESHAHLKAAIAMRSRIALDIRAGDALELLPAQMNMTHGPVCVLHANCLYQWPPALRERFDRQLCELSATRDIHRISIESTGPQFSETIYMGYHHGNLQHSALLGRSDGYARWIEWF